MGRGLVTVNIVATVDLEDYDDCCDFSDPVQLVKDQIECVGLERMIKKGEIAVRGYEVKTFDIKDVQ